MNVLRSNVMAMVILLTACGGDGNDSNNSQSKIVAQGRFVDSVVDGLSYSSGEQSGITDSQGGFTYEVGKTIIFNVGTVELGTVSGAEIITPVDITSSNSGAIDTQNIVRFLLMLDSDGDSSNGISISGAVRSIATNWQQVDFSSSAFANELTQIISDVSTADNRVPILPDIPTAQSHLEDTLSCLSSGVFAGTFSGDDNGTFLLWIQHQRFDPAVFGDTVARVGVTSALIYSTDDDLVSGVAPQEGLSFDSDKQFISGLVSSGAQFSGQLEGYNIISNGSWQNDAPQVGISSESGVFSGKRIAGQIDATHLDVIHRLSGFFNLQNSPFFSADGTGLIALDVFADNSVTGTLITLRGEQTALTGSLNGDTASGGIINISGGGINFTLGFDANGTDTSSDAFLGDTSGFIGQGDIAGGTVDIIGTSCPLN